MTAWSDTRVPRPLFAGPWQPVSSVLPDQARELASARRAKSGLDWLDETEFDPGPDADFLELFERANKPDDPRELIELFLSRVESRITPALRVPGRASRCDQWLASRPRRTVTSDEVLSRSSTPTMIKGLFNSYFRDDLYGDLRRDDTIVLSSGSVDEHLFGLPAPLRECIEYALRRDWYGYSDSRGRDSARDALARYESARTNGVKYDKDNICIGLGGTALMSGIADLVLCGATSSAPAVCGIPNYPPLVQAVSRRGHVQLAPIPQRCGRADLSGLIDIVNQATPLVMLQTALNPTGALVPDSEIQRLLAKAGASTTVVLDECHEWLGQVQAISALRADPRVIRVNSVSKNWSAPGLKIGWFVASREFVSAFYEYSSTNYGGPASIFYTMTEFMARMERWRIEESNGIDVDQFRELEDSYELTLLNLQRAFTQYCKQRKQRADDLEILRDAGSQLLHHNGVRLIDPAYSINTAVRIGDCSDGYTLFRELLAASGVSVFPGILTLVLSDKLARFTSARSWDDLHCGLIALARRLPPHVSPADPFAVEPGPGFAGRYRGSWNL